MFLNVDNVGAERISSGRLFQATGPATQMPGLPVVAYSLSWVRTDSHGSETKNRKVRNSRNWDAQFVEITWCQAVNCQEHQKAKFEQDTVSADNR